jgi:hypothetical protein
MADVVREITTGMLQVPEPVGGPCRKDEKPEGRVPREQHRLRLPRPELVNPPVDTLVAAPGMLNEWREPSSQVATLKMRVNPPSVASRNAERHFNRLATPECCNP